MVMIETREAAQDKAIELIDELHELGHLKKMVLCELEDTLYDCFESSNDDESKDTDEGTDLGFKKGMYNRHYAMRNFEDDEDKDVESHNMRAYRRRAMRMRRNRMGRFA